MTDKDVLFTYRLKLAEETIEDARKILNSNGGNRSIVNRAYYSMFYIVLALFLKSGININTAKI